MTGHLPQSENMHTTSFPAVVAMQYVHIWLTSTQINSLPVGRVELLHALSLAAHWLLARMAFMCGPGAYVL